jgi:phosphocarrier protein HPr
MTLTRELHILNKAGIHARPAAMFVRLASKFQSDIFVIKDGEKVNGKSIMGLLMLAAGPGSRLHLEVVGPDAEKALCEIEALINGRFGET